MPRQIAPEQAAPEQAAPEQVALLQGIPSRAAPKYRTLLAFDHGKLRIGVAVGQEFTRRARPLSVLTARQGEPDWSELLKLLHEWQPDGLIVGVPRHADGRASKSTKAALAFCAQLEQRSGLPVLTIDERLSSNEAKRRLEESPRQRQPLDSIAAAVILETWLNQQETASDAQS